MNANPRLLLVDDEPAITGNLAAFLERAGFVVGVAADGEAALRLARETAPDLIVMDVSVPKVDRLCLSATGRISQPSMKLGE